MKKIACIATFHSREAQIGQAVESLRRQVDELYVCANAGWIDWTPPRGVKVVPVSDRGDASKFYCACKKMEGYLFTCDDDIVYPPDYVRTLMRLLRERPRSVVGVHGSRFRRIPVKRYHSDRDVRHCLGPAVDGVRQEHLLGTGTTAWHSSTLKLKWAHFENGFMGDVWLAIQAQRQRVPMLSVPHPAAWLKPAQPPPKDTILRRTRRHGDEPQIKALARVKNWRFW